MIDRATEQRLKRVREKIIRAAMDELAKGDVTAVELLAILAHTTGACVAMQDRRDLTPQLAMDLVSKNIEAGNLEAVSGLLSAGGRVN